MKPLAKTVQNLMSKNASDLLLVGGVGCIIGGGIWAIRKTPKVMLILEDKKEASKMEKVKAVAPSYIPAVVLVGVGIAQIVCSRNITNNKIAAIATAYTVSDTAFRTYRDKVKDMVEPEKYEDIRREVAADKLKRDPIDNKEVFMTNNNESLMYDEQSGRYFRGSINDIDRAVNLINNKLRNEMTMNLNDFYNEIGLPIVKIGCDFGWKIDDYSLIMSYSSCISESGEAAIVLDYDCTVI